MSFFCCHGNRLPVRKAKTKRKVGMSYHAQTRLANQMARSIKVDLVRGITTFKKKLKPEVMEAAVRSGSYGGVIATIPWEDFAPAIDGYGDRLEETYGRSASLSLKALPKPVSKHLRFDVSNPAIKRYIQRKTGNLIIDIHKDTQKIVQRAVHRSFTVAATPRDIADQIRDSIGLDPRRAQALTNYRTSLETDGKFEDDKIDRLVDSYGERLLSDRALTIGRTEARRATNQGQLSVWKEAANEGFLDRQRTKKVWIVDGNPCDICEPMDGVAVPLEGAWTLNNGDVVEDPTDSHPNCMCGVELEFEAWTPGEDFDEEDAA